MVGVGVDTVGVDELGVNVVELGVKEGKFDKGTPEGKMNPEVPLGRIGVVASVRVKMGLNSPAKKKVVAPVGNGELALIDSTAAHATCVPEAPGNEVTEHPSSPVASAIVLGAPGERTKGIN